jgi:hypothetical protein
VLLVCFALVPVETALSTGDMPRGSLRQRIAELQQETAQLLFPSGGGEPSGLDPQDPDWFRRWRELTAPAGRWRDVAASCSLSVRESQNPDTTLLLVGMHLSAASGRWLLRGEFGEPDFLDMLVGLSGLWDEWVERIPGEWCARAYSDGPAGGTLVGIGLAAFLPIDRSRSPGPKKDREGRIDFELDYCERLGRALGDLPGTPFTWMAVLAWDDLFAESGETDCVFGAALCFWRNVVTFISRSKGERGYMRDVRAAVENRLRNVQHLVELAINAGMRESGIDPRASVTVDSDMLARHLMSGLEKRDAAAGYRLHAPAGAHDTASTQIVAFYLPKPESYRMPSTPERPRQILFPRLDEVCP